MGKVINPGTGWKEGLKWNTPKRHKAGWRGRHYYAAHSDWSLCNREQLDRKTATGGVFRATSIGAVCGFCADLEGK